jgi:hypothetical protein
MTEAEEQSLRIALTALIQEHRDIDAAIASMVEQGARDQLQLTRLKKRKLQLKDQLLPNIIA